MYCGLRLCGAHFGSKRLISGTGIGVLSLFFPNAGVLQGDLALRPAKCHADKKPGALEQRSFRARPHLRLLSSNRTQLPSPQKFIATTKIGQLIPVPYWLLSFTAS